MNTELGWDGGENIQEEVGKGRNMNNIYCIKIKELKVSIISILYNKCVPIKLRL